LQLDFLFWKILLLFLKNATAGPGDYFEDTAVVRVTTSIPSFNWHLNFSKSTITPIKHY
jgi:hypothetical protein